jgi:hypothetical protein
MKANELRIGNWVKRKTQPDGFQIGSSSFRICELHPKWYEPITLTKERLIEFGFSKVQFVDSNNMFLDTYVFNDITIYLKNFVWNFGYLRKEIKYVHQLQNLFFALTGEELTLK